MTPAEDDIFAGLPPWEPDGEQRMDLPCAIPVEGYVIGALLSDCDGIDVALGNLTDEDFYNDSNRLIFLAIQDLRRHGKPVDSVTTAEFLQQNNNLKVVGGLSRLTDLTFDRPGIVNLDGWIEILRTRALSRRLIRSANLLRDRAMAGEDPVGLLEDFRSNTARLAPTSKVFFRNPEEILEKAGGIDEFFMPSHGLGIEPPLPYWAERMRFEPKSQTILAGVTGGGKSALAFQCIIEAAKRHYRVALYGLEMEDAECLRRMVAQEARVNMHRLRMGIATEQERWDAARALEVLLEYKDYILIRDEPIDIGAINNDLQRLTIEGRPAQFCVVDHLLLMQTPGRVENRTREVSALSRGLKNTWSRFRIPGLVLTQFSRQTGDETEEPELKWLKESGDVENDATNIVFLWPKTLADRDNDVREWRMKLAKVRNGPCGRTDLLFRKKYTRFDPA